MIDLTFYMGTWYKSLMYIAVAVLGSTLVSFLMFDGSLFSHFRGASLGVFIACCIGYIQKRQQRYTNTRSGLNE
ncbi:hypothetical protein BCU36_018720 [Vibrio lentus]|uniref:hypothetical protein n=1 Tax=Vibrio lentus TaxID=136468 RepID=UPI000C84FBD8|nr:hypothetical protein [Vibrio lentus]PMI84826.1 hypothetical protein BCU36_04725 [Vibrio lentus]